MRRRIAAAMAVPLALGMALLAAGCGIGGGGTESDPGGTEVAVHVAPISRATLHGYVTAWGRVEAEPATQAAPPASARVAAPVPGLLAEVRCAEGERVEKGAVLFQLDSRVADVAVERARRAVDFAERQFERQQTLGPGEGTSQRAYQEAEQNLTLARNELESAQAQRDLLRVRAPLAGTVVRVEARPGDTVDLTNALAEIVDLDRLVVAAAVRSVDIDRVEVGLAAEMWEEEEGEKGTGKRNGRETIPSEVTFVGSAVDPATDVVTVRLRVPADSGLRPGQFVGLRILTEEHRDCLTVPVESVVTREGQSQIAVVEGSRAVMRPVTLGLRDGGRVEVEGDGIEEGMRVVTEGAYGLPPESRIRVIAE